jgi:hypothetical protein
MPSPPAILALTVAIAGWFYLFYSRAAQKLDGIESPAINQRRSRLRRLNGAAMLLLAAGFYAGCQLDPHPHPVIFLLLWTVVLILLILCVLLAVVDLRLTARLRRKS